MYKKLTIILAVVLLLLVSERVIFTSSDVKFELKPEVLRANLNSELEIEVYRINMLGFKVPFSRVEVSFRVEEGSNLVELHDESADGKVKVRSKGIEGEATIGIYALRSGAVIKNILIKILPRDMAELSR
jgi:hypothetical protein